MKANSERAGIKISIIGGGLLALSAVVMALIAESQAILLDGLYTLITLVMAFVSLKVIDLVERPETRSQPFGLMALEPFFNLARSLVMLILLVYFLITNIQELCTGGRLISLNMTSVYILICLIIYAVIILFLKKCQRGTNSSILALEIKNWCVDALITGGIAVSLVVAMIFVRMGYASILPYIDPMIVVVLVLASFCVPLKVFLVELKRLLLVSTENSIEVEVKEQLAEVIQKYGLIHVQVWGLKSGRTHYLFVYSSLEEERTTIEQLDLIRAEMFSALSHIYSKFWADIMFTKINPEDSFCHPEFRSKDLEVRRG